MKFHGPSVWRGHPTCCQASFSRRASPELSLRSHVLSTPNPTPGHPDSKQTVGRPLGVTWTAFCPASLLHHFFAYPQGNDMHIPTCLVSSLTIPGMPPQNTTTTDTHMSSLTDLSSLHLSFPLLTTYLKKIPLPSAFFCIHFSCAFRKQIRVGMFKGFNDPTVSKKRQVGHWGI